MRSNGQEGSASRRRGAPRARRDTTEAWSSTGRVSSRNGVRATGFLPREFDCPCATALPLKTTSRTGVCASQLSSQVLRRWGSGERDRWR